MGRKPCCGKQGLKRGTWSSEEDQLLINYINQHGHANWPSLPKKAGLQRDGWSCRLRWTNHLAGGMERTPCCDKQGLKKGTWSSEEDELLINYINEHGHGNWDSLAKNAGLQRCGESCRNRWTNYLAGEIGRTPCGKQGLKKGAWSSEEDELLINYINEHGHRNWRSLPKNAGLQRCGWSCRRRWKNNLAGEMGRRPCYDKQGLKKGGPWSSEEDQLLINYINEHGHGLQRRGKSCRVRWTNYLAGEMRRRPCCDKQCLKKVAWSPEEDQLIINYINEHGHGNWPSLAKNAGLQRCGNSCKHRWIHHLAGEMGRAHFYDKHGLKKGAWSSEEDQLLINYINQHGHGNWSSLPKNAGLQRNGINCRLRWKNYLTPGIKRGPFTPEEENLVFQSHKILGNRWAAIAIQLPGRTDNDIKNLWNIHLKKRLVTMGLDPQTHEPISNPRGPKPPRSSSTDPNPQEFMESARLEAEARLSRESLIYNPYGSSSYYSDVLLPLWESEVGESFQKENTEKSRCQSPVSETSSSTKCASSSVLTQRDEDVEDSESHIQLLNARSNSSGSDVVDDSSVFALQLLLDFPEDNDTSFLEIDVDDYLVYPSDSSND
ncbi:uncharacterized protein LOC141605126 isoform X2 [Silene latifolia]|uniref:uncharacterized protein LOC141605126 isoform X2 n=1 Tax=Silene latifolia TaxID=37657 RepID=UPI003D78516B